MTLYPVLSRAVVATETFLSTVEAPRSRLSRQGGPKLSGTFYSQKPNIFKGIIPFGTSLQCRPLSVHISQRIVHVHVFDEVFGTNPRVHTYLALFLRCQTGLPRNLRDKIP